MIAVSNTTPLRYLIAIEQQHLLGRLFKSVFVPSAVHEELTQIRTPESVRLGVVSLPAWYEVRALHEPGELTFPASLHRGEREAILLAEILQPELILIDEQIGREIALARGLPVSGTLGILERADVMGLIEDFHQILHDLKTSGFYISDALEHRLLQRHNARQENK